MTEPRWLTTPWETPDELAVQGVEFIEFAEAFCPQVKESITGRVGDPTVFRPWQHNLFRALLRTDPKTGLRVHRTALIGKARKNGKSHEGSSLALEGLVLGPGGGEVYSCAADKDQARIVFDVAKRMVKADPFLDDRLTIYRDAIDNPTTGTVYKVLSSDAFTKEGLNPTLVIFDEVHAQPSDELWLVMEQATGNRREPLLLGITTAGVMKQSDGRDTICYRLYQHGVGVASGAVEDPSFFFAWWEPEDRSADHRKRGTWEEANPGIGDLVAYEDFEAKVKRTPESDFRTKRCNQWVATASTWLPVGAFEARGTGEIPEDGVDVVLAFDGSYSGDSTGIVGCTLEDDPHLFVVGVWESEEEGWRVPIAEVETALEEACRRWRVGVVVADPYRWARSLQALADDGLPIEEFPQSPQRMVPATKDYSDAVLDEASTLTHDNHPALVRHHANAKTKQTPRGYQLSKESRGQKIDLAVCSVMALAARGMVEDDSEVWAFTS